MFIAAHSKIQYAIIVNVTQCRKIKLKWTDVDLRLLIFTCMPRSVGQTLLWVT